MIRTRYEIREHISKVSHETNIDSNIEVIWNYNASTNSWQSWASSIHDTRFRLEPGEAYWINMTAPDRLVGNYNLMPTGPTSPPYFNITGQSWKGLSYN